MRARPQPPYPKNDGGAAFPVNTENAPNAGSYMPSDGMSLRDYFIAHAPAVPDCYQHDDTPPMGYEAERELPIDERTVRRRAEERRAMERVLSWPGYWADEQLKRRGV